MNLTLLPLAFPFPIVLGILAFVTILLFLLNYERITRNMISAAIAVISLLMVLGLVLDNVIPVILSFTFTIVGVLLTVTD